MGMIKLKQRLLSYVYAISSRTNSAWLLLLLVAIGVLCVLLLFKGLSGHIILTDIGSIKQYRLIRGVDEPKPFSSKMVEWNTDLQTNLRLAIRRAREAVKKRRMQREQQNILRGGK